MDVDLDQTHDPSVESWVTSANDPDTDFPLQNLPIGRFRGFEERDWRIGIAIGDELLDVNAVGLITTTDANELMSRGREYSRDLRRRVWDGLRIDSHDRKEWAEYVFPQRGVELGLPCRIGDYTDFYASIDHARTVGKQFRPDSPLMPNYQWMPIGYHGRASSISASPDRVRRPHGQRAPEQAPPSVEPSRSLDFELELAAFIGAGNRRGEPIPIGSAESSLFGVALFNDWSARDLQSWEYRPLGPFLGKNFASTLSPWVVTMDALAPFRTSFSHPAGDPQPLDYLASADNSAQGGLEIALEVWIQTQRMRAAGVAGELLTRSDFRYSYWTLAQMVAHHTVGGCNLQAGDLLATGTMSGPGPDQFGSLIELTDGGRAPVTLSTGERRGYLDDGDSITLRASCDREGFRRIGFGDCTGIVVPAW